MAIISNINQNQIALSWKTNTHSMIFLEIRIPFFKCLVAPLATTYYAYNLFTTTGKKLWICPPPKPGAFKLIVARSVIFWEIYVQGMIWWGEWPRAPVSQRKSTAQVAVPFLYTWLDLSHYLFLSLISNSKVSYESV